MPSKDKTYRRRHFCGRGEGTDHGVDPTLGVTPRPTSSEREYPGEKHRVNSKKTLPLIQSSSSAESPVLSYTLPNSSERDRTVTGTPVSLYTGSGLKHSPLMYSHNDIRPYQVTAGVLLSNRTTSRTKTF